MSNLYWLMDEQMVRLHATYLKAHRTASSLGVKKGGPTTRGVA